MTEKYIKNKQAFVSLRSLNNRTFNGGVLWDLTSITQQSKKSLPFFYNKQITAILNALNVAGKDIVTNSDMPSEIRNNFNEFSLQLNSLIKQEELPKKIELPGTLILENSEKNTRIFLAGMAEIVMRQWGLPHIKGFMFSIADIRYDVPLLFTKTEEVNSNDNVPLYTITKQNDFIIYNALNVNDDGSNSDFGERARNILQFMDILFFDPTINVEMTANNIISSSDSVFIINCIEGLNRSVCYVICMMLVNPKLLAIFDKNALSLPKNERLWKYLIEKLKSLRGPTVWGSSNKDFEFILSYLCEKKCNLSEIKRDIAIIDIKKYIESM